MGDAPVDDWLGVALCFLGLGVLALCVWRVAVGDWWLAPFGMLTCVAETVIIRKLWEDREDNG